jgi:hypothetical protein
MEWLHRVFRLHATLSPASSYKICYSKRSRYGYEDSLPVLPDRFFKARVNFLYLPPVITHPRAAYRREITVLLAQRNRLLPEDVIFTGAPYTFEPLVEQIVEREGIRLAARAYVPACQYARGYPARITRKRVDNIPVVLPFRSPAG